MKDASTLCTELATELLRLADCSRANEHIAVSDPKQYLAAAERHFMLLLPLVADIKKAHEDSLTPQRITMWKWLKNLLSLRNAA